MRDLTGFMTTGSRRGLEILQAARTADTPGPAIGLITNAIDHVVFGGLLASSTVMMLLVDHKRNSTLWHAALDVSGYDCAYCGLDTTWHEVSVLHGQSTYHLCPDCSEIPVLYACPMCHQLETPTDLVQIDAHAGLGTTRICSYCATMPRQPGLRYPRQQREA